MKRLAVLLVAGLVAVIASCDRVVDLAARTDARSGSFDGGSVGDGMAADAIDTALGDAGVLDSGSVIDGASGSDGASVTDSASAIDGASDALSE